MGTNVVTNRGGGEVLRDTQFGRWVIEVLRHLHDPLYLQSHPLNSYVPTEESRPRGDSLRHDVTGAIDELCRASLTNRSAARCYDVLKLYYVQCLSRTEILNRLQISRTEFHRAQAKGQERLIRSLARRWGASVTEQQPTSNGIAVGALIPTPFDSFVGRTSELGDVERLLLHEPAVRQVTIYGPPGCGKTRLAIELAKRLKRAFKGGVFYIPFAAVGSPAEVPGAIAVALGLTESSDATAQVCIESFFRNRQSLLVLDNLEHLPGTARVIASLLSASPRLKVLVTTRCVLRLTGEHCYPLSPLAIPEGDCSRQEDARLLHQVEDVASVQLFVDRARASDPAFSLTPRNVRVVCKICRQVDGLPLGIELVAARIRSLGPNAILERLEHRLDLASGRDADRPARQQSLRTAICWSYDLLGSEERRLFRLLGIFDGPCALEAIEAVAGSANLLDTLDELVAQSLVRRGDDEEGKPYFDMLATIRELAVEELKASGEWATAEDRYLAFYRELVDNSVSGLRGPRQISWANRLAILTPNLTRALHRMLDRHPKHLASFVASLGCYWHYRSQLTVGREWSERALKIADSDPVAIARVRLNAAVIGRDQGDVELAQRYLETSLREFQALGDDAGSAICLNFLGLVARYKGDYALAQQRFRAGRAIHERINSQWGIGWSYYVMGTLAEQQRYLPRARTLYERALAILSDIGDLRGVAGALSGLGNVQRLLGDVEASRTSLEEALRLQRLIGNRSGSEQTLLALSGVAHRQKDFEAAHKLINEAIDVATEIGDRRNLRMAHAFRMVVLKSEGKFAEALQIAEEVLAMCRQQGDVPWVAILLATIGDLEDRLSGRDGTSAFRQSLEILNVYYDRWATARTVAFVGLRAARHARFRDALVAFAAAEAIQAGIRTTIDYSNGAEWATLEARARECLGPLEAAAAFDEGKTMSFGRAIAAARGMLDSATLPSEPSVRDNPYSAETRSG